MKFIFRTDATQTLGSGHVMRCLSLARVLHERGAVTCFVALDMPDYLEALLNQEGHTLKRIPTWARGDDLADAHATVDGEEGVSACILDHYGLGEAWERRVQASVPVFALDDLGRAHCARWLLDQNIYANPLCRYERRLAPGVQALLGPKYALLRPEFERARCDARVRDRGLRQVLVFLGGMDADNVTSIALQAIDAALLDEVYVTVIAGVSHPALADLDAWCSRRGRAVLKVQVKDMTPHLLLADLAIGAGGTSTWERCACGLPTVAVCLADNQREVIRQGSAEGFLWGFDNVPQVAELAHVLRALANAPSLLAHMSRQALSVTDGRGVQRVAAILMPRQVEVRAAAEGDARMIYEWRTHPSVQGVSRSPSLFSFEEHCAWMRQTLANSDRLLLVGVHEGRDMGVVRFDIEDSRAEVSIFLAPGTTGRGLGRALLGAAEAQFKVLHPGIRWLDAWVNEDNPTSRNMFNRLGYSPRSSRLEKEIV